MLGAHLPLRKAFRGITEAERLQSVAEGALSAAADATEQGLAITLKLQRKILPSRADLRRGE
jgi:hypothetical protein